MNHNYEFILLLNKAKFAQAEVSSVLQLDLNKIDQAEITRLVTQNNVINQVYENLDYLINTKFEILAKNLKQVFEKKYSNVSNENILRRNWGAIIFKRFNEEEIEFICLKGFLFAETIYHSPTYKKMNDIDLLLPFDKIEKAINCLKEIGFFSAYYSSEKDNLGFNAPPMFASDHNCLVSLHWGLRPPTSHYTINIDDVWKRSKKINLLYSNVRQMCSEDNIVHLCMDMPHFKSGLRELGDIANIFLTQSINENTLFDIGQSWNAFYELYRCLSFVKKLYPTTVSDSFILKLETHTSPNKKIEIKKRCQQVGYILNSRTTIQGDIEKIYLLYYTQEILFKKIIYFFKGIKLLFFPPLAHTKAIYSYIPTWKIYINPMYRLLTPFNIIRALGDEYGANIIIDRWLMIFAKIFKKDLHLKKIQKIFSKVEI